VYSVQEETNKEVFFECLRLGEQHYNEVESKSTSVPYKLNYKMADAFIEAGLVRVVTARKNGELVGYFGVVVVEDFFTSKVSAKELGIFVKPEHRKSSCFYRMMKKIEKLLHEEGVESLQIMFKVGHDTGLACKAGYEKTETVYQKFLGE